jgi:hypothetical protein
VHPSWGAYPDTVLHFPEADLAVDLRCPITPSARRGLAQLGLAGPFAVVTPCDPLGQPHDNSSNQRLMAVFQAVVRGSCPGARRADGASPDGSHVEPGWALPMPLQDATMLAARFFQNGLFWYEANRFRIVPVLAPLSTLELPGGAGDP